jgi:hypothetical protein
MEEKFLKLFELANILNESQSNIFAEIKYVANDSKKIEIYIRKKDDFSYIEKCEIMLVTNPIAKLDAIIDIFTTYIKGTANE